MKFEVYGEENEDVTRLRLINDTRGVYLVVCDENGKTLPAGHLLRVTCRGFERLTGIREGTGMPLDRKGRIEVYTS